MLGTQIVNAQHLEFSKIKNYEHQLDDVMELIDTAELKIKLKEVETAFNNDSSALNRARLGIIYHEIALNLGFLTKTKYKGYAAKSFDQLTQLFNASYTEKELLPFVASYRASALSLVGAETKKLSLLGDAFVLFKDAVEKYATISYLPEFLRGSVAENLPWYFISKRKVAMSDFQSIIDKEQKNSEYANWKIMSFTYWTWANQHQQLKYRDKAINYLQKSISLDPSYKAGRGKAEALLKKFSK